MKTKSLLFAFGFCALLLSGCAASVGTVGPDYGYYPPAQPYYGAVRPYYYHRPRPVVVVPAPYYRQPVRPYRGSYRQGGATRYQRYDSRGNYGHGNSAPRPYSRPRVN